jgi:hypothetical protein
MNTSESAYNLCICIRNIIENAGWNETDVLGCTNYIDTRLILLLKKCAQEKYIIPKDEYDKTNLAIELFCEDVRNNNGTYYMGTGIYTLQMPENKIKMLWQTFSVFHMFSP